MPQVVQWTWNNLQDAERRYCPAKIKHPFRREEFYDFIPSTFQQWPSPSGIQGEPSPEKPLQPHRLHPILTGIKDFVHAHFCILVVFLMLWLNPELGEIGEFRREKTALLMDQCMHFPSYDITTHCLYLVFQEILLCLASHSDHLNLEIHETLKRHWGRQKWANKQIIELGRNA